MNASRLRSALIGAAFGLAGLAPATAATAQLLQNGETVPGQPGFEAPDADGDGRIEQRPLDNRFQRAPFRTYRDNVGPSRPERIDNYDSTSHAGVRLRALDKMTGGTETVDVEATGEIQLGHLRIRADACRTSENPSIGGTIAFLKIWDQRSAAHEPDFSGWMFADSPALSAFDHPRYDVWVIRCITASGEAVTASE